MPRRLSARCRCTVLWFGGRCRRGPSMVQGCAGELQPTFRQRGRRQLQQASNSAMAPGEAKRSAGSSQLHPALDTEKNSARLHAQSAQPLEVDALSDVAVLARGASFRGWTQFVFEVVVGLGLCSGLVPEHIPQSRCALAARGCQLLGMLWWWWAVGVHRWGAHARFDLG